MDAGGGVTWWHLAFALGMSAFGFYYALTTKPGERRTDRDPAGFAYNLRMYAKGGGWVFAIGGLIGAVKILDQLLSRK